MAQAKARAGTIVGFYKEDGATKPITARTGRFRRSSRPTHLSLKTIKPINEWDLEPRQPATRAAPPPPPKPEPVKWISPLDRPMTEEEAVEYAEAAGRKYGDSQYFIREASHAQMLFIDLGLKEPSKTEAIRALLKAAEQDVDSLQSEKHPYHKIAIIHDRCHDQFKRTLLAAKLLDEPLDEEQLINDFYAYSRLPDIERWKKDPPHNHLEESLTRLEHLLPIAENRIDSMLLEGKNVNESNINAITEGKHTSALLKMLKDNGYVERDGKIRAPKTYTDYDPRAFQFLRDFASNDSAFEFKGGETKMRCIDPSRVCMYDGKLDFNLHLPDGIYNIYGSDVPKRNFKPDIMQVRDGKIILKKLNQEMRDYDVYGKGTGARVKAYDRREVRYEPTTWDKALSVPKIPFTSAIVMDGKDLKDLAKSPEGCDNFVRIAAEGTKYRVSYKDLATDTYHKTKELPTASVARAPPSGKADIANYSTDYLTRISNHVDNDAKVVFNFADQMPCKIEVSSKAIKGDFYLAPRSKED